MPRDSDHFEEVVSGKACERATGVNYNPVTAAELR
jgi:hypothetical protein